MNQSSAFSKAFKEFSSSGTAGGILLFFCVTVSLIISNSSLDGLFVGLLDTRVGFDIPGIHLTYTVSSWINDGLMAIFFLLVGLEIKRELVTGELATPAKAFLPVICALGGALVPAGIYMLFNAGTETFDGWGIPMATDIAFSLAIINLLGKNVPPALKIFLAALAIVDDLVAILVIAIFYSAELHTDYLLYAGGVFLLMMGLNLLKIKNVIFYLVPGAVVWYLVHHSGIHATIAGVLTAFTIPVAGKNGSSPLEKLEHILTWPVNFIIIPVFAFANTDIHFEEGMLDGLFSGLGLGIVLGLLVGKPVGIFVISWLAVKLKIGRLPEGAGWMHMLGVGLLAGIGFTMSIFISLLSFSEPYFVADAKFAILIGSFLSGLLGFILLKMSRNKPSAPPVEGETQGHESTTR